MYHDPDTALVQKKSLTKSHCSVTGSVQEGPNEPSRHCTSNYCGRSGEGFGDLGFWQFPLLQQVPLTLLSIHKSKRILTLLARTRPGCGTP